MSYRGKEIEDLVENLLSGSFLGDFVVRESEVRKPGGQTREAGDLILRVGDVLITFQVRSIEVDESFDVEDPVQTQRVVRKIEKAVRQIGQLKRLMRSNSIKVLKNVRGVEVPFECKEPKHVQGVVLVCLVSESGSPAELFPSVQYVGSTPVHPFQLADFKEIVGELDTVPDLVSFLEVREKLLCSGKIMITSELDYLVTFVTQFEVLKKALDGELTSVFVTPGSWEAYKSDKSEAKAAREDRRRHGQIFDEVVSKVHGCLGYDLSLEESVRRGLPSSVHVGRATPRQYLELTSELGMVPRALRMSAGQRLLRKARAAETDEKGFTFFALARDGAIPIGFVLSRQEMGELAATVHTLVNALALGTDARKAICIGLRNFGSRNGAAMFSIAEDVVGDEESVRLARELLGTPRLERSDQ